MKVVVNNPVATQISLAMNDDIARPHKARLLNANSFENHPRPDDPAAVPVCGAPRQKHKARSLKNTLAANCCDFFALSLSHWELSLFSVTREELDS